MDNMREEFEAWFLKEKGDKVSESYQFLTKEIMYEGWKASRAALRVELPGAWILAEHEYKRQVEESLDSAGVSYE